jgi:hypothetical protein
MLAEIRLTAIAAPKDVVVVVHKTAGPALIRGVVVEMNTHLIGDLTNGNCAPSKGKMCNDM